MPNDEWQGFLIEANRFVSIFSTFEIPGGDLLVGGPRWYLSGGLTEAGSMTMIEMHYKLIQALHFFNCLFDLARYTDITVGFVEQEAFYDGVM